MKKLLIGLWLALLVAAVCTLFWYNEYRYSLPTPVPQNYKAVSNGTAIKLLPGLPFDKNKPVLLHFFNPDCPCSRFNLAHVKQLIKQYNGKANFAVVLVTKKEYTPAQISQKFDLDVPVITNKALALACGVYSTPQAVILNKNNQLVYRGNYNSSRYCTNKKTEYARQALDNLLQNVPVTVNPLAAKAYGCSLADNTQPEKYVQ